MQQLSFKNPNKIIKVISELDADVKIIGGLSL